MSPKTRSRTRTVGVKPNLLTQIKDATVSKKKNKDKQNMPEKIQPPTNSDTQTDNSINMEVEDDIIDIASQNASGSTTPPPSFTAAEKEKGKGKDNDLTPENKQTEAT